MSEELQQKLRDFIYFTLGRSFLLEKCTCDEKNSPNIWCIHKKCVPLQTQLRELSRCQQQMVTIVQLVRASDCGSECRGFESH